MAIRGASPALVVPKGQEVTVKNFFYVWTGAQGSAQVAAKFRNKLQSIGIYCAVEATIMVKYGKLGTPYPDRNYGFVWVEDIRGWHALQGLNTDGTARIEEMEIEPPAESPFWALDKQLDRDIAEGKFDGEDRWYDMDKAERDLKTKYWVTKRIKLPPLATIDDYKVVAYSYKHVGSHLTLKLNVPNSPDWLSPDVISNHFRRYLDTGMSNTKTKYPKTEMRGALATITFPSSSSVAMGLKVLCEKVVFRGPGDSVYQASSRLPGDDRKDTVAP